MPWFVVIASATALGWILTNTAVGFQHLAVDEAIRQDTLCFAKSVPAPVVTQNETSVDNPCGIGDYFRESYKPFAGLIYGPLYLLCCSLPYWLISGRRSAPGLTRQIAWLALGALVIEWAATIGECIRPGYYLGGMCTNRDPYIWPPATIAAALIISSVVTTQLLHRFAKRV
jgi:hypothetical protein